MPGGLERYLGDLADALPPEEERVVYYAGDPGLRDRLAARLRGARLVAAPVETNGAWNRWVAERRPPAALRRALAPGNELLQWLRFLPNVARLREAFRALGPVRLVAVNGGYPAAWSAQAAVIAAGGIEGMRAVLALTGVPRARRWPILDRLLDRAVRHAVAGVVSVSGRGLEEFERLRGYPAARGRVIPSAVAPRPVEESPDLARARELMKDRSPIVGSLSPMETWKGQDHLIDAVELLRREFPTIGCLLVGEGGARAEWEERVRARGLRAHVGFTGFVRPNPSGCLAMMNVFVYPTRDDASPHAVLEAMAQGRPVVATNVGGIPEQVVDGETGMLVPPGDPRALADAVAALLRDPARAARMGAAGAARARSHFSPATLAASFRNLLADR